MTGNIPHIAIIGAGLAGSVLSNRLVEAGFLISVYDKSRGTGGRLSSCRIDDISADLGAPYFDTTDPDMLSWLKAQPKVKPWQPKHIGYYKTDLPSPLLYVVEPRQSALTRSLMEGSTFVPHCRIGYIWPEKENQKTQVILRDEHGKGLGNFDAVIVTAPAPQATTLLEAVPRFAKRASEIETHMNWVAVIKINPVSSAAELISGDHPVLRRCVKDSAKPGRAIEHGGEVWLIEANACWSEANRDSNPEQVFEQLKSSFYELLDINTEVLAYRCHRWLYSAHKGIDEGYLWDSELSIGACGDWLQGEGLSGAWESANLMADRLIKDYQAALA